MKQKLGFQNFLFYPEGLLIFVLLNFSVKIIAQETTPPEKFFIGTEFQNQTIENTIFYDPFYESGMNMIQQRADTSTHDYIDEFNVLAANGQNKEDWIHHYTTGYYSKWEAEENQTDSTRVGIKHYDSQGNTFGEVAFWDSAWCWSTKGLSSPACSLMYGPHYRQDNRYKRWLYDYGNYKNVQYVPRFRMALAKDSAVSDTEDVCEIKVVYRYKVEYSSTESEHIDSVFLRRTLKVSDFNVNGNFDYFYLHDDPALRWYKYPSEFILPENLQNIVEPQSNDYPKYIDWESYTGIQFWVDWLRDDDLCTVYIDYVEVYDNNGWDDFIDQPEETAQLITDYALKYDNQDWQNLKYWMGGHEPTSIDAYTPIKTVDDILQANDFPPLMNTIWALWNQDLNGESQLARYYNTVQPNKLLVEHHPIISGYDPPKAFGYELIRKIFFNSEKCIRTYK